MELNRLGQAQVLRDAAADVAVSRELARRRRLLTLEAVLVPLMIWMWARVLMGDPVSPGLPGLSIPPEFLPGVVLAVVLAAVIALPMAGAGRSPHVLYRPSEIDVSPDDVKGAGVVVEEVVRTLNLFLAPSGHPLREPPDTGRTYMARAVAREAGVTFLFVSFSA